MNSLLLSLLATTVLPACIPPQSATTAPQSTAGAEKKRPKLAIFTFSGGFKHDALELAEQTIRKIGESSGAFEAVTFEQFRQPPDKLELGMITAARLRDWSGVLFYTTSGEKDLDLLTPQQRTDLMAAVKGGMGFVGVHSATDTFYKWPEYGEMIGAYFDGHPWTADSAPVTIKVEDTTHPATRMLGANWFIQDEIYQFKPPYDRSKLHILLSLDTNATDMSLKGIKRTDGDFAIAWSKLHGDGRVFYTALGHRKDVWENEAYQQHLLGGIRWALKLSGGKPAPESPATQAAGKTPDGLEIVDLEVGHGEPIGKGQTAVVQYTGKLEDGTQFDTSRGGEPLIFKIGGARVVKGMEDGVLGMRKGGKRKLIIPPALGYGESGSPPVIPPNATLIFEVELTGIR